MLEEEEEEERIMRKSSDNTTPPGPPDSGPGTKKPERERPPLLKRSKTSISNDTHFPGPLFPAVRRASAPAASHPARPDLRVSVNNNDSDSYYSSSSLTHNITDANSFSIGDGGNASSFGNSSFSDRDWMYPSFLGPHVARNRVTVKGRRGGGGGGEVQGSDKKLVVVVEEEEEEEKEKSRSSSRSDGSSSRSSGMRMGVSKGREDGELRVGMEGETAMEAGWVLVAQPSSVTRGGGGGGRWSGVQGFTPSWVLYLVCN